MKRLTLAALARADIEAAFLWLDQRNPAAASRWLDQLERRYKLIREQPGIGAPRDDILSGLRCVFVPPYAIYYRAEEDRVEIIRVLHGRRDRHAVVGEE